MRVLGLDLGERELRVARGERLFGAVRVTALARIPFDDQAALDAALGRLAATRPSLVLAALPASYTTHRTLVLPFRGRRRLAETVPLELLGQLPLEPEDARIAFAPLGPVEGGTAVLAAVARRADIVAHAAPLVAAGLAPSHTDLSPLPAWNLVPPGVGDAALLLADGAHSALTVRRAGRVTGLRALGTCATDPLMLAAEVRWSLAALGDLPPTLVLAGADACPALAAALGEHLPARVVSLAEVGELPFPADDLAACVIAAGLVAGTRRQAAIGLGLQDPSHAAPESFRPSAALAAAALLLALLDWGLLHHGLAHRDAALVSAIHTEAASVLPDGRLLAPRAELEAAVTARARRYVAGTRDASVLTLLRELSTRVPGVLRLDLDELAVEPDVVSLHGRTEGFDAVDTLRRGLAASPLFSEVTVDDTRTTLDGRQVEFRLHAARRPSSGASS